ncbi:MAG: class I SAM-dependent methyltransferase [Pseudomonadota bacterium]
MRFPGGRTIAKYKLKSKKALFDVLGMDAVMEERRRQALVVSMGFEGQWDDHRAFQMDFLRRNGLTEKTRFLEYGSGPLTLGLPLMRELAPGGYTGVDVRDSVMNLAYEEVHRAGQTARNPRLIVASDFGAEALAGENFDMIWSFSVLYHLSDDLIEALFANIKARLAPQGTYWANINTTVAESQWLEFPFLNRAPDFYAEIAGRNGLALSQLGTIAELGFVGTGPEKDNTMLEIRHA